MQEGIKNEYKFVNKLNNKIVNRLEKELKCLLYNIFSDINENDRIICWKSCYQEKSDIKVKIRNEIKGISIKTGSHASMHQESIKSFYPFLVKIGVNNNIIEKFDDFMKGYQCGKRVSSKEYINNNPIAINDIIMNFNEYYIKLNLIIRFLFQGTEKQIYGCDAIIHGTPNSFIWATKEEIIKYLLDYKITKHEFINISALNIKAYDRNLRNNKMKILKQDEIQIKWFEIEKHLKNIEKLNINQRK